MALGNRFLMPPLLSLRIILEPSGSLDQTVKVSGAITPMAGTKKRRSPVLSIQSIRNRMVLFGSEGWMLFGVMTTAVGNS